MAPLIKAYGLAHPPAFRAVSGCYPSNHWLTYAASSHKGPAMHNPEDHFQEQGTHFSLLSDQAFTAARQQAFASGNSLVESSRGVLYHVSPDGTRRVLRQLEPPTPVVPGTKLRLP